MIACASSMSVSLKNPPAVIAKSAFSPGHDPGDAAISFFLSVTNYEIASPSARKDGFFDFIRIDQL
jgi:hypothetical protein